MYNHTKIKKNLYIVANKYYGHSRSQILPYDEIEIWHGHPDLYMEKLEELYTLQMIAISDLLLKLLQNVLIT